MLIAMPLLLLVIFFGYSKLLRLARGHLRVVGPRAQTVAGQPPFFARHHGATGCRDRAGDHLLRDNHDDDRHQ